MGAVSISPVTSVSCSRTDVMQKHNMKVMQDRAQEDIVIIPRAPTINNVGGVFLKNRFEKGSVDDPHAIVILELTAPGDKCPKFKIDVHAFDNPNRIVPVNTPQGEDQGAAFPSPGTKPLNCFLSSFDSVKTIRQGVTLIAFFDAECCHCRRFAFPALREVVDRWEKEAEAVGQVQVLPIGRGNGLDVLSGFIPYPADRPFPQIGRKRMNMASDPDGAVFRLFADALVPRWYVLDVKGVIQFQAQGFTKALFEEVVANVDKHRKLRSPFLISLDSISNKFQLWNVCPFSKQQRDEWMTLQEDAPKSTPGRNLTESDVRSISKYNDKYNAFVDSISDDGHMFIQRLVEISQKDKEEAQHVK